MLLSTGQSIFFLCMGNNRGQSQAKLLSSTSLQSLSTELYRFAATPQAVVVCGGYVGLGQASCALRWTLLALYGETYLGKLRENQNHKPHHEGAYARPRDAYLLEMHACKMHACEVHAHEVHAYEVHAHEMHAREVHSHEIHAHRSVTF
jgi:hypothetical protein